MPNIKTPLAMNAAVALVVATILLTGGSALAQQEILLHSFNDPGKRGDGSPAGGLVLDKGGNLYGGSTSGGDYGAGAVYELSTNGAEHILYSFNPATGDAAYPEGSLILDSAGNLYGATN